MTDINQININTIEGKYLMAALAKLTTESQTDKTPYEVLAQVKELAEKMYESTPTASGESMEDVLLKYGIINGFSIHSNPNIVKDNSQLAMSEWASIQCADRDLSYQRLTEQFQLLADKVIKKDIEITKLENQLSKTIQQD